MRFKFKGLLTGATALSMIAVPVAASAAPANPAAKLSVANTRAATPARGGNKIAAGSTATLVSIGILAALVVVVLVATGGSEDARDSN